MNIRTFLASLREGETQMDFLGRFPRELKEMYSVSDGIQRVEFHFEDENAARVFSNSRREFYLERMHQIVSDPYLTMM